MRPQKKKLPEDVKEGSYSMRVEMLRGIAEEMGLNLEQVALEILKDMLKKMALWLKVERAKDDADYAS